jgi:hypothetical protein
MRNLRDSINSLMALLLFCLAPMSSAAPPDLRLIALVPPDAQVVSGIGELPHEPQPDRFVLLTHNNAVDLQDLLALYGADGSRTIQQVVFVAIADKESELREHSLLVSGHFDKARIYKSATESGAILIGYRGIPVLEIQPFARERDSFKHVRWLAVLDSNVLVFGTIPTLRRELDRYSDRCPPDSSLLTRLAHLRSKDQTWSLLSPRARNDEIRRLLSTLDPELTEIAQSGRALEFGIHYGRRVEFEYEITLDPKIVSSAPAQLHVESLADSKLGRSLLSSPNTIAHRDSARGLVTIPMTDYRAWLEEVKRYADRCLFP